MPDFPIIFSAPMIQALLRGDKTMTRRLAWRERKTTEPNQYKMSPTAWQRVRPMDRLWVRENFAPTVNTAIYRADGEKQPGACCGCAWRPSIFLPRRLSRFTLIITATKIERLQDISEEDAKSEGAFLSVAGVDYSGFPIRTHRTGFVRIWNELHGDKSWLDNPEVVAVSFRVIKANIDAPEAKAA